MVAHTHNTRSPGDQDGRTASFKAKLARSFLKIYEMKMGWECYSVMKTLSIMSKALSSISSTIKIKIKNQREREGERPCISSTEVSLKTWLSMICLAPSGLQGAWPWTSEPLEMKWETKLQRTKRGGHCHSLGRGQGEYWTSSEPGLGPGTEWFCPKGSNGKAEKGMSDKTMPLIIS